MSRQEIQQSLWPKRRRKYSGGPEHDVMKGVIDFVNCVPGFRIWRQNVGARDYLGSDGRKHLVFFGKKGMADVSGIGRGLRVEIEVKREGEEPDEWQQEWLNFIRKYGGIAFWCDSIERCRRELVEEFERRGWKRPSILDT